MRSRWLVLALGLAALGAVGCATKPAGVLEGYCATNQDCPLGQVCNEDSRCAVPCSGELQCEVGQHCENGLCVGPSSSAGDDGGSSNPGDDGGISGDEDGGTSTPDDDGGSTHPGGDGGSATRADGGPMSDGGPVVGGSDGGRAEQCHQRDARESCGSAQGTCVPGVRTCNGEFWSPCVGAIGPAAEECDGLDHNCDGLPDNRPSGCECRNAATRPCYNGPAGTQTQGSCRAGAQTCVDGRWGSCSGAVEPRTGVCSEASCTGGLNPGCDCQVGAQQPCYTGLGTTWQNGICHKGTATCVAAPTGSGASWGTCVGEQTPEAVDRCDGRDHNCDGIANNAPTGCVCTPGQTQSCYTGPPNTQGVGTCRAGTQTCAVVSGTAAWGACSGEVTPSPGNCAVASCTGANNPNPGCDCINARTRSCYDGPAATQGVGACHAGTQTCTAGAWATCAGQVLPASTDVCVAPTATFASSPASDLTCNGALDRHNPTATPTATAPTQQPLAAPTGYASAVQVEPLDTVTLRGGASDVDGAGNFSYRWRLISAPTNNTAGISGAPGGRPTDYSTQQNPTIFAQLAGDYTIGVTATDSTGCTSDEVRLLVRIRPHQAIHLQLTWDQPVDVDLQLVQGETSPIFTAGACYWGGLTPDWGTVDPSLDIDDLSGCNPENINYGSIGGTPPPVNSSYAVWVHYYCNRRGHRSNPANPSSLCYENTTVAAAAVNVTVKVFVQGVLAKIDGTNDDAIFTTPLAQAQTWKPAKLRYDGVWRVVPANEAKGTSGTSACTGSTTCTCASFTNPADPYCGTSGAACRQRFP